MSIPLTSWCADQDAIEGPSNNARQDVEGVHLRPLICDG